MTTYEKTMADSIEYLICAQNKGYALGFRGDKSDIMLAYNLFYNFDPNADAGSSPPRLHWIHESCAYIYTTMERIKASLHLFFYLSALHEEIEKKIHWDEENGILNIEQDEGLAKAMADKRTAFFLEKKMKIESFIPRISAFDSEPYNINQKFNRDE